MPEVSGVLETSLYVEDVGRSSRFYRTLFGFEPLEGDDRFVALSVAGAHVLLLFRKGAAVHPIPLPGGTIPPHDGTGNLHLAFSIPASDWQAWEERLADQAIGIESVVNWPRGGRSVYFR